MAPESVSTFINRRSNATASECANSLLGESSVIRNFRISATDGNSDHTQHYNLSAMASMLVIFSNNVVRSVEFCRDP